MLRSFLNNTKYFLITSTIALTSAYGYCYWRCAKNEKDYLQAINADTLKDASRLTNESFGISWGFQADDTVMNSIDSGDLFFIKYDCLQTLSPLEMIKCYRLTIPLLDEEYHAIGIAYRDQNGLMAYSNEFGRNRLMRYSQLVSLPYIKQLMVQKTKQNIHSKLVKLLQEDRAFDEQEEQNKLSSSNKLQTTKDSSNFNDQGKLASSTGIVLKKQSNLVKDSSGDFLRMIKKTVSELISPEEDSFTFINRVLKRLQLLDQNEQIVDLRELLSNQKQVNIRTQTNKMLRSL